MRMRFNSPLNYCQNYPVPETNFRIWYGYGISNKNLIKIE